MTFSCQVTGMNDRLASIAVKCGQGDDSIVSLVRITASNQCVPISYVQNQFCSVGRTSAISRSVSAFASRSVGRENDYNKHHDTKMDSE